MTKNGPIALLFHACVVIFILAPLLVVVLVAFTPENTLTLSWTSFSLRWFEAIWKHGEFVPAFINSIKLGMMAATLSVLIAVPAAMALVRYEFKGRQLLNALFLSPLMIPHLVLGVALLRFFALLNVRGSFEWLVLAHVVIITPYALRLILAALIGFDRSIEQAAMSLGASRTTTFIKITLPIILPGIAGAWMLAFINSFDELTLSIFVTSPQTVTLPVRMYMYATESIDPMMAAVSACMIFLTAIVMVVLDRIYGLDKILVGEHTS